MTKCEWVKIYVSVCVFCIIWYYAFVMIVCFCFCVYFHTCHRAKFRWRPHTPTQIRCEEGRQPDYSPSQEVVKMAPYQHLNGNNSHRHAHKQERLKSHLSLFHPFLSLILSHRHTHHAGSYLLKSTTKKSDHSTNWDGQYGHEVDYFTFFFKTKKTLICLVGDNHRLNLGFY